MGVKNDTNMLWDLISCLMNQIKVFAQKISELLIHQFHHKYVIKLPYIHDITGGLQ